ncbi:MAG TPA: protein kinase, partial [Kofleriaceae bacterium]
GVPSPRLIDFGIARFLDDSESEPPTADRFVSGTPEYLAPELVHGDPPTIASDLYAVGVILYELVAGVTPFAASTKAQVMRRRLRDEPLSLVACCPDREISPLFDAVVAKALARDVGRRYANANEFLTALRAAAPAREILEPLAVAEDVVPFSTRARTVAFGSDAAERSRGNVSAAVERGDGDAIVVAYLDLVSVLVENHRLTTAIDELEEGIALFLASRDLTFRAPVWRLMLSLAALYDGNGDRRRAWITARSARDQAALAGSSIGCKRADQLRSRLVGSGTRARTTQNGRPQRPR